MILVVLSTRAELAIATARGRSYWETGELGVDSPIPKFIHFKIPRRDGVESLTTLQEGGFKVLINGCISP